MIEEKIKQIGEEAKAKEEFFETIITQEMYEDMIKKPEIIGIINRLPYDEALLKVRYKRNRKGAEK